MSDHYDTVAPRFKGWETPLTEFKKLDDEFHFDFDAAASHENALCDTYATIEGCFTKLTRPNPEMWHNADGLEKEWDAFRVFCNPPYDASLPKWVDKAFQFEAEVAVLLLPPNFETTWGQRIWNEYRSGLELAAKVYQSRTHESWLNGPSVEIRIPPYRIRFNRPALKGDFILKDYELWGEEIFDYSLPRVPGNQPRSGNLIAVFRK